MTNGYTTIQINGEAIGLKFGLPSVQMLIAAMGKNPDMFLTETGIDGVTKMTDAYVAYIVYSGYRNNMLLKDAKPEHDYAFFMDYIEGVKLDSDEANALSAVTTVWTESREVLKVKQRADENEEVKKKNLDLMKSNPIATDVLE